MKRWLGGTLALVLALGTAAAVSSPVRRSRAPWLPDQVRERLAATPCGQDPALTDAELIAALRRDVRDPCGRIDGLIDRHPAAERWLQTQVLGSLAGPEGLRLRAAQTLVRGADLGGQEIGLAEFRTGHLGPRSRQSLLEVVGSDVLRLTLPYDPTGRTAALRFAAGDWSAREELAEAIYAELRWPTLPASETKEGLGGLPAELVQGALAGLGWDSEMLRLALADLEQGRPVQHLDAPALRLLQDHDSDCSSPTPGCLTLLMAQLDSHAGRVPLPTTPVDGVPEADWARFSWAAESIRASPSPEGRLLGLVAHPNHTYGPIPWAAGQRGEPSLALRYAGSTPAASASAALALGQATGIPVQVYGQHSDLMVVEVGSRSAHIGPCGPGSPEHPDNLPQLSAEEVRAWALRERIAGLAAAGDMEAAILASGGETGEVATPQWRALRAALLACQGIRPPGVHDPALASLWARSCGQIALAEALQQEEPRDLADPEEPGACAGSLWVPAPHLAPA